MSDSDSIQQARLRAFVADKGLVRQPAREKAYGLSRSQPIALRKKAS